MDSQQTFRIEPLEPRRLLAAVGSVFVPPTNPRLDLSLNGAWKFLRADASGASTAGFNDASWSTVNLPHTWNNSDGQDGGGNYYRGAGWYRKKYTIPASFTGRRFYLKFDGASQVADVYVNGVAVGNHQGAYGKFTFDITPYVTPGQQCVLAVRVTNAANASIAPVKADFTVFGGLHRDVHLLVTRQVMVSPTNSGSTGLFIAQRNVSSSSATIDLRTEVRNSAGSARTVVVESNIVDAAGRVVNSITSTVTLPARSTQNVLQSTVITSPRLWNGRIDPYLYTVHQQVSDGTGVYDVSKTSLGIRYYGVDPQRGFLLNGKPYELHGVNMHQDRLNKGSAVSEGDIEQDVSLLLDIGATAVRLVHYQHDEYLYELLDRVGLVAWTEIPIWQQITESAGFTGNIKSQLKDLIRQQFNHPSVMFWGLFNEVDDTPAMRTLIKDLNVTAKAEDPTRLTVGASDVHDPAAGLNTITDLVSYNRYLGWYSGQPSDFGPWLDGILAANPNTPIGMSEWGAGASINQHSENPTKPIPADGPFHPEEYQSIFHEQYYAAMEKHSRLWCRFVWQMFDSGSDVRGEGDTRGRNDKGLVTYDRKTKKDAYYYYKARWSSDPVLYLTSRRFTNRPDRSADIKVYSNLGTVSLTVNGNLIGTRADTDGVYVWSNVALRAGANDIRVTATRNGKTYTDQITWNAPASRATTTTTATTTATTNRPAGRSTPFSSRPIGETDEGRALLSELL